MSYILEALRRAEAERQRGAVPHLHAQPALAAADRPARSPGLWPWAGVAALVAAGVAVGGAAWWLWPAGSGQVPTAATAAASAAAIAAATVAPAAPTPAPVAVMPAPPPISMPAPAPKLVAQTGPAAPTALPSRTPGQAAPAAATPVPRSQVASAGAPGAASTTAPAAAPGPAPGPAPATSTASPRLPQLAELPEAFRSTLPPLTLGGAVHSAQAAQRLVILNGQVFHEGDRPLPDLLVEQIRPRSVVLNFRGQAFELAP